VKAPPTHIQGSTHGDGGDQLQVGGMKLHVLYASRLNKPVRWGNAAGKGGKLWVSTGALNLFQIEGQIHICLSPLRPQGNNKCGQFIETFLAIYKNVTNLAYYCEQVDILLNNALYLNQSFDYLTPLLLEV
jgi:hypothetical protein